MRTFQPLLFSAITLLAFQPLNAQINHSDPEPDMVLQMPVESYNNLHMDIDGDQVDDIRFQYTNYPSFSLWNLGIVQPDTANESIGIMYEASISPSPIGDYYVKQLSVDDNISSSGDFSSDYPQVGDVYYGNFNGQTDKYIGFRLKTPSGDKYGWMAIELSGSGNMTFTIKEYAYHNTPNTAIKAGETGSVGIVHHTLSTAGFQLFPNPVSDYFNLTTAGGEKISLLQVFTIAGSLVAEWQQPALPFRMETSRWEKGIYLVKITAEGHTLQELLVKD